MNEDLFGKYGIAKPPEGMSPQDVRDAQTARIEKRWHEACAVGRCAYAGLEETELHARSVDSTTHCGGWHGERRQDGSWWYRRCQRHEDWMQRRNAYVRRTQGKTPRKGYDDDSTPF